MKDATTIAVSKAIKSNKETKAARSNLTVGQHPISTMVHLDGTLTVEADQEITPTASLMNEEFLFTVLHCAGVTRESALKAIKEVAGTYLIDWTGSSDDKKAAKAERKAKLETIDPQGKMADVFSKFKAGLPKIPRAGKVTFKGAVSEVALPVVRGVENTDSNEQVA